MESALTGLVGLVGVVIGAVVTLRVQDRTDRADRRRQAAQILGRLRAFVDDHPADRWAINASDESWDVLEELRLEWRDLRPQIFTLMALYPDQADDVEELFTTTGNLRVEIANVVRAVLEHSSDLNEWMDKAKASQKRARELVKSLMTLVGKV